MTIKISKYDFILLFAIALIAVALFGTTSVFASQQQQQQQQMGQYVVRWPDGTVQKYNTRESAEKAAGQWKVLAKGTSDADGKIVLKDWISSGKIRVREIQPPKGYLIAGENNIVKTVSDKKADFINVRSKGFVVRKMDQYRVPLEGVGFEVYGKPVMSLEKTVKITKKMTDPTDHYNGPDIDISGPKVDIDVPDVDVEGPDVELEAPVSNTLEREFRITVEGIGDTNFYEEITIEKSGDSKEIRLKPGKYVISEPVPSEFPETSIGNCESYLRSYRIEISRDGKLISDNNEESWFWCMHAPDGSISLETDPEYIRDRAFVEVKDNEIVITNYGMEPPKWK